MKKTLNSVVITLFFIGLVIGLHYLIFSLLRANGSFDVKEILVKGEQNIHPNEIIRASQIRKGMYLFSIDLKDASRNVQSLAMISTAQVRRIPPSSIEITVSERTLTALVTDDRKSYFCDEDGYVLPRGFEGLPRIITDFPVLISKNRIQEQFVLIALKNLSQFKDSKNISQITFRRKEGVYIILKGLDTVFYIGNKLVNLEYLNLVYSLGSTIKDKKLKIKYVDVNKENPIGYE